MSHLLNIQDSTDPLIIQTGNPNLKFTCVQNAYFSYNLSKKRYATRLNISTEFNRWRNKTAIAQLYNNQTGVTTFRPMNVNGNKTFDFKANYSTNIDKKGNWSIANDFTLLLARSVDFSSSSHNHEATTHTVENTIIKNNFKLDYRINQIRIGAKATFTWTGQNSLQGLFERHRYGSQGYGLTFTSPLCWDIDFDTDFMVYKRFGYMVSSMNTADWIWNASLMKNFGKNRQYTAKIVGFDILRQLSNIRHDITAQGYVERVYNTVTSYILFSLAYRLDVKPSRKK